MGFCTAINCMDGRVQLPVIEYLRTRCSAQFVDIVSEPGPNRILAEGFPPPVVDSILARVRISVERHGSRCIAVVGHHDCAGNPVERETQDAQTRAAAEMIAGRFPDCEVLSLWVDETWAVHELDP